MKPIQNFLSRKYILGLAAALIYFEYYVRNDKHHLFLETSSIIFLIWTFDFLMNFYFKKFKNRNEDVINIDIYDKIRVTIFCSISTTYILFGMNNYYVIILIFISSMFINKKSSLLKK
jgi:hypothetical protein